MGHPRPRPKPEASPFSAAVAALAPSPAQLDMLENLVALVVWVFRNAKELDRAVTEHEQLLADNARLQANIRSLTAQERSWQAAVTSAIEKARATERDGIRVEL
jgi:hypothetical protein